MADDDFNVDANVVQLERNHRILSVHITFSRAESAKEQFEKLQAMLEAGGEIKLVFNSSGPVSKQ